jgi:hypothetical protein
VTRPTLERGERDAVSRADSFSLAFIANRRADSILSEIRDKLAWQVVLRAGHTGGTDVSHGRHSLPYGFRDV